MRDDASTPAEDRSGLRAVPTEDLVPRALAGDRAACEELDRRGIEPPTVEPGPPPVPAV